MSYPGDLAQAAVRLGVLVLEDDKRDPIELSHETIKALHKFSEEWEKARGTVQLPE